MEGNICESYRVVVFVLLDMWENIVVWDGSFRPEFTYLDLKTSELGLTAMETEPIVVFLCPYIYYWVLKSSFVWGETNERYFITNNGVVNLPLNRNNTTDSMCDWMEVMVGKLLMRTEPMNELDFLFIIILLGIVIYCFKYIRNHK